MKCAIRELRGMSEVRISEEARPETRRVSITITNEDFQRKPVSRDSSCPPTSGWRARLLIDQETEQKQKEEQIKRQEMMPQHEKEQTRKSSQAIENKERKIRRVRKTSDRRKRLDTINSESDYSVRILTLLPVLFLSH